MDLNSLDNYVLGAGTLFWDPEDDQRQLTGQIYLGNTPAFSNPVTVDTTEKWDNDKAIAERQIAAPRRVTRNLNFTGDNISPFLLGLFYYADTNVKTQAAGSETASPINEGRALLAGRRYSLGQAIDNPTGVRNVSEVTINIAGDPPTVAQAGTDYTLEAADGDIVVLEGGALAGATATADFTLQAEERPQIVTGNLRPKYGALRYKADNTEGPNRDIYMPRVLLTPNGEAAWKDRENFMSLQFSGMVLTRYSAGGVKWPQVIVDGQPVVTG